MHHDSRMIRVLRNTTPNTATKMKNPMTTTTTAIVRELCGALAAVNKAKHTHASGYSPKHKAAHYIHLALYEVLAADVGHDAAVLAMAAVDLRLDDFDSMFLADVAEAVEAVEDNTQRCTCCDTETDALVDTDDYGKLCETCCEYMND